MPQEQQHEQDAPWTKEARDYTLAGLSVVREFRGGTEEYGSEFGRDQVLKEFREYVQKFGGGVDADGLASIAIGLTRLADLLLDWIQSDANNKQTLLGDVRKQLPDYQEPTTYPSDPKWSNWVGVLLSIEKLIKESPTSD